ncbi:hypothetical protein [Kutzneria buriramensis]|uniref:Uncharacterized protein n=1 Tax=Kutzneria buriramensis TaxID=1045776 RepID=A0A3E0GWD9_9PSEU|nr:hypothetical protein [Kutzneria buriramensis]REH28627.1 hypothetical protein BCF44_12669 [Kutzneria buriramensis]
MNQQRLTEVRGSILRDLHTFLHAFDHGDIVGIPVFGTADPGEIQLRQAGALLALLLQHQVDERGRCTRCRPVRSNKRHLPRWPRRKALCQVWKVAVFFASAPPEQIWLKVLPRIGIRRELDKIRANLMNSGPADGTSIPAQATDTARHALRANDFTA